MRYRPSPAAAAEADLDAYPEILARTLARNRDRDRALGHTGSGPHRDEMVVELDGNDLRKYGSAGQVRASMIVLKLGKISMVRKEHGEAPLFLMDDFDSDLDEVRAAALAHFLHQGGFQALVATSKDGLVDGLGVPFMRVRMDDGAARVG